VKTQRDAETKSSPAAAVFPMPLTGARRIENERVVYRDLQRQHQADRPGYARGWRRPSDTTAARVLELTSLPGTDLTVDERLALVVVLDAAIQAGEDKRQLSHNLVFDVLASRWSDWYRAAVERGPARVSWEMNEGTLKGAWRDLGRNDISLAKLLRLAQHGYGLYAATKGRDGRYTVNLAGETEERRSQFLSIIKEDAAHGGNYERRSSWPRLRLASEPGESTVEDATTYKVVAETAYNVAVPGERSMAVIRQLEGTRLFVTAGRFEDEYDYLMNQAESVFLQAGELGVDVTQSGSKKPLKTEDIGKPLSAWRRHLGALLAKAPKADRAGLKKRAIAFAKQYDKAIGQASQLYGPMEQLLDLVRAGKLKRDEEVAIRTRYAKLSNRRFQARDFWFSEITGKTSSEIAEPTERYSWSTHEIEVTRVASRRGRLFRVAASRSQRDREISDSQVGMTLLHLATSDSMPTSDIQDLVGVDVSGSQIQIYAVLLGLRTFEEELRTNPAKAIFAWRAWDRHTDARDPFTLPDEYTGPDDPQLQAAVKYAELTSLYDSKPDRIVERLEDDPDEYGPGLGTAANLALFLRDRELGLDVIEQRWKPTMRRIAALAYKTDKYAGVELTDPFDGVAFRLNPIKWAVPQDRRVAGVDDVWISAKVPVDETTNAAGDLPAWRQKMSSTIGTTVIHKLDAMFCGFVVEELAARGVKDVVSVHDAFYTPADAEVALREAIGVASVTWFKRLGTVYDELERLLGPCMPFKRGPKKGQCRPPCGCWIGELRAGWKARVDAGDYPSFLVGDASPAKVSYNMSQSNANLTVGMCRRRV